MFRYVANRVMVMFPLLFALSGVLFIYMRILPGDPVRGMLGPEATPELVTKLRKQFGLDQTIFHQYITWIDNLFHGNLGISFTSGRDITPLLFDRIPATLQLLLAGFIASVIIGIPLGFLAGRRRGSFIDNIFSPISLVGLSLPIFWIGTLFVIVFGVKWKILPAEGYIPFSENPVLSLKYTILPALTLGFVLAPYLARLTRAATIEVEQEPFMQQARAKGLQRKTIMLRYSARNVFPQMIVVLGMQIGGLLGGQVIVEQLFNWPGVGRLLIQGALQRDYNMVQAVILVVALIFILINLVAEILHAFYDKRIRL